MTKNTASGWFSQILIDLYLQFTSRSQDTQHNYIQHNGTQQNDIQHNDVQHNNNYGSVAMLSVAAGILAVVFKLLKIL
jgi:hypothetical protein